MAGLQSQGIGSGLDVKSLIDQLMAVEKKPLTALDTKEATYQAKLTAYGSIKSALAAFQSSAQALSVPSKISTLKATPGDATVLTATTSSIAKPGNYNVEVTSLAQSQKLYSEAFTDVSSQVGVGSLSFEFGTYTYSDVGLPPVSTPTAFSANPDKTKHTVTISAGNSTLTGIRDAINTANIGVNASIVNDGEGYRLVMTSKDSGAANAMKITAKDENGGDIVAASGLSSFVFNPDAGVLNQTQDSSNKATNAVVKIDGITVTKSSNSISDAIQGVTLNLLKIGGPTPLKVASDSSGLKASLDAFVKAFNDFDKTAKDLGGYDLANKKGGILLGDSGLRAIQAQVRNVLTSPLDVSAGGFNSLADIGLTVQRDGTLALDSAALDSALADQTKNVAALFAPLGIPSDGLISYVGNTSDTKAGQYGISLTQPPTHGTATGSASATLNIGAGNDALSLTVDGIPIAISLTHKLYASATALATEIQLQANTALAASGKSVSVTQASGVLTIASNKWGSISTVALTGGSARTSIFGTPLSADGKDVAGSIGDAIASGTGQILTGGGDASGLSLLVEGGSAGDRGSVSFGYGYAYRLNQLLTRVLDEKTGTIAASKSSINSSISDIGDRRIALQRRLDELQKRYQKQFTALDVTVASMQQTSAYLSQQLASLSKSTGN